MAPRRALGPALLALLATAVLCAGGTSAQASGWTRLADTAPRWANAHNHVGNAGDANQLVFSVWLDWSHQSDLDALLAAQQNPASPQYGQWLTPQDFRSRFAPSPTDVSTVQSWLHSQGFSIVDVPQNRLFVTASGTVAQVEKTFGVDEMVYSVDGHDIIGPNADPELPDGIAASVSAITGLDGAMALATPQHSSAPPPPPIGRSVGPCSQYWAQLTTHAFTNPFEPGQALPWITCGYTPQQIDSAYGIGTLHRFGLTGRGQTIAITGAFFSPTIRTDVDAFSRHYGLPHNHGWLREVVAPGTTRYPKDPSETQSWYIEQSLDVEWAHAVAPEARVVYVGAANDSRGLDQALNYAVDNHVANVISNSWGMPESFAAPGEVNALTQVFEQADAEGIGVYFASGDYGDNLDATGTLSAGFPDDSPLVTSVGGTSLGVGRFGQREFETGWGSTDLVWKPKKKIWNGPTPGEFIGGAGGGASHLFAQPGYQAGVVPSQDAIWHGSARRAEPDIAMDADPDTGVIFSQSYSLPNGRTQEVDSWIGGTSVATPMVAGLAVLADQFRRHPVGFLNPRLYKLAGGSALNDILPSSGSLAVLRNSPTSDGGFTTHLRGLDHDSSLKTAFGWDPVTGMGTPQAVQFVLALR